MIHLLFNLLAFLSENINFERKNGVLIELCLVCYTKLYCQVYVLIVAHFL